MLFSAVVALPHGRANKELQQSAAEVGLCLAMGSLAESESQGASTASGCPRVGPEVVGCFAGLDTLSAPAGVLAEDRPTAG